MMNCPHCETEVDEHEANRCLDAWVYYWVFDNDPGNIFEDWRYYSTDIAAAWEVHKTQIRKLFSKRRRYLLALEEELREREKHTVAWPDALIFLSPLAICRAAIKTTIKQIA